MKDFIDKDGPILVTGGAGFIGSHLVDKLLSEGYETHVLDNLSTGNLSNIKVWEKSKKKKFFKLDLMDKNSLSSLPNYELVYHCAADPDVRTSVISPEKHFKQNVLTTLNLLDTIKEKSLKKFVFISTSTVYGDATIIPTPENYSPLEPISPYGASKLACEALIASYAHTFHFKSIIFRLANIVGLKSNHGVIYDFLKKLYQDPTKLEILGDGKQKKSYLHVSDCINAIQCGLSLSSKLVETFNVGSEDSIDVTNLAKIMIETMSLTNVTFSFTGGIDGGRGWKGDVKEMMLDISKLKNLGWSPKFSSAEVIRKTTSDMYKEFESD